MQFCFHQSSCQSCSEEEQELNPTHPIHLMTALGHNKIRNLVVRGSGSSHNIFPWRQCRVLPPFSETNNPHTPFPRSQQVQAAEMLQTNELPRRLVRSQPAHTSNTSMSPDIETHSLSVLHCGRGVQRQGLLAWIWQSVLWVLLTHFLVAELLKSISGHNFQAVFYDYEA